MRKAKENPQKEKPQRAAIYLRVSTSYQADRDSLPMQRKDLVGYCEYALNISDYTVFEDAGYSGKNTDRPAFQKMMMQIRNGMYSHLLVWKIDRISRNLLDFAQMYEELKTLGVTFISRNEQFDTSTAMGEAMLKMVLIFAELERKTTAERVTATMISRANDGTWNGGRVPFGYDYNKETQTFSINGDESYIVLQMYDLYEKTDSLVRTARELNKLGYVSRQHNPFSPVSIWIILRNPWYVGTYRYNYYKIPGRRAVKEESEWVVIENHHSPLVSKERFDHVQKMLDSNARYRNTPGRSSKQKNVNIFSGLIWCSCCGAAFTASPGKLHASGYRPTKYGCPNVRKTKTCNAKYTSDPVIGEFLLNFILNVINAQKGFEKINSPADLESRLLRGDAFRDVAKIDSASVAALYEMLSSFSPADSVLLKKPTIKKNLDPELRKLRADKRKTERALTRLDHIYLYSNKQMSDKEYLVKKNDLMTDLKELDKSIGLLTSESWAQSLSDDDFLEQASSFIISQRLQEREYIYFQGLAESTDPAVLRAFFVSIIDSVRMRNGLVETLTFKNGISHTFTYKAI
jgi:DNA invertase Pin-like site-specific DNA recombinase|nr:MAG TPA: integrase [Caudoviricetes sp.]